MISRKTENIKIGLVVGSDNNWSFIRDLYDDWQQHYRVDVFKERVTKAPFFRDRLNRRYFRSDMSAFLSTHNVTFFEWATHNLIEATKLPQNAKIVTRLHSYELYDFAPHVNWPNVDRIILVSLAMQRRFSALYPQSASRTEVIYNGVDLERFRPRDGQKERTIGMLCNLIPIKRVYGAILNIYELRLSGYPFRLRIGGTPHPGASNERYYASLQHLIGRLELQDCVSLEGFIDQPASFLNEVEIFLSNSFWEGQQVALLEAMASGCFCLSHHWDGAEEVLPNENLYLADSDFRQKLISYAESSSSERLIRRHQMRTIAEEKFDITQTKHQVRAILESAILS